MKKKINIFVVGTRGIPGIQGGIERHCEKLYPRIVSPKVQVYLCTRNAYVKNKISSYRGIKLIRCYAPRNKYLETISHTLLCLIIAISISPDIIHIHAIGPSILTPLAKLLGFKVVVTNHGPDYKRKKWGKIAQYFLKLGEKFSGLFADELIVISKPIQNIVYTRCRRKAILLPNGAEVHQEIARKDFLNKLQLQPKEYILAVGRFVPEKGFHQLLKAFNGHFGHLKLVIVGDADHETSYSSFLRYKASKDKRVILTGMINGDKLSQIYSHARLFILPSSYEGFSISLLEALSYGLPVLVSDIEATRVLKLPDYQYFQYGNISDLRTKIKNMIKNEITDKEKMVIKSKLEKDYNWDDIARKTIRIYEKALKI